MADMLVFRCGIGGRSILIESLMIVPTVSAMTCMHEEVTAYHQGKQGIIPDRAGRYVENKDGCQGDHEAGAQHPHTDRDPKWPS